MCVYYMTGAPEGSPKVVLWINSYTQVSDPGPTGHLVILFLQIVTND